MSFPSMLLTLLARNYSLIFPLRSISSGLRFFLAMIFTSDVMYLFFTSSEVYTNFGTVSNNADFCISPKSNDTDPWFCDWWLYKELYLVECFFLKLKEFRRIATRYDKLAKRFLAFVLLGCIRVWLA